MTPTSDAPVLEIDNVTSGYGDLAAIRDVTLTVRTGEIVALFGPNGAGKSTTLLTAIGTLPLTSGQVRWWGAKSRLALHKLARRGVSFVPEQRSVIMGMSVRDNLRIGRGGVDPVIAIFPELAPLLDRRAGLCSGGEQQMLIMGRALASRPKALLIDELSLGLAPIVVERLFDVLRTSARADDIAVLLVEQQARRALELADRWYLLRNGRLAGQGDASEGVDALESAYLAGVTAGAVGDGEAEPPDLPKSVGD